jgi:hypothetical protein
MPLLDTAWDHKVRASKGSRGRWGLVITDGNPGNGTLIGTSIFVRTDAVGHIEFSAGAHHSACAFPIFVVLARSNSPVTAHGDEPRSAHFYRAHRSAKVQKLRSTPSLG